MKKTLSILMQTLLILVVCLSGCVSYVEDEPSQSIFQPIDPDHLEILGSLGFDPSTVIEKNGFYIVEGDILFEKVLMNSYAELISPNTRQYSYKFVLHSSIVQNINIAIDPSVAAHDYGWYIATLRAIEAWNQIPGSAVKFNLVSSGAHTTISMDPGITGDDLAWAYYPTSIYTPGPNIKISTFKAYLSTKVKTTTIAHELGHIIGLVHSDWYDDEDSQPGNLINGTPVSDPGSLMNARIYEFTDPSYIFSYYDIVAIRTLYPSTAGLTNKLVITNNVMAYKPFRIELQNNSNIQNVTWVFENANPVIISGQGTTTIDLYLTSEGSVKIHALDENLIPYAYAIVNVKSPILTNVLPYISRHATFKLDIPDATNVNWLGLGIQISEGQGTNTIAGYYDDLYQSMLTVTFNLYGTTVSYSRNISKRSDPVQIVGPVFNGGNLVTGSRFSLSAYFPNFDGEYEWVIPVGKIYQKSNGFIDMQVNQPGTFTFECKANLSYSNFRSLSDISSANNLSNSISSDKITTLLPSGVLEGDGSVYSDKMTTLLPLPLLTNYSAPGILTIKFNGNPIGPGDPLPILP